MVPIATASEVVGAAFLLVLLLSPLLYVWLRSRGILGDAPGRGLQ